MNRILCLILPMAIALASACDHDSAYVATPHVATWEFMQSVGGIAIGQPEKIDDSAWVLPIRCDVSGLTTVTREPKVMHSGVVVTRMLMRFATVTLPFQSSSTLRSVPRAVQHAHRSR
jgi:hypothetical protein